MAAVKARTGQVAEAIKELEAVDARARSGNVVMGLATYYLQAKRPSDSQRLLEPIVGRFPKLVQARYLLGAAYMTNGKFDLAAAQFEELARQVPNEAMVRLQLAAAYSWIGKPKEALVELDRRSLDTGVVNDTLGVLLKYQDDIAAIRGSEAARILDEISAS